MPSVTNGVRLDPRTSCATRQDGLQARIHDPLWLLTRQWQFGEWRGGDAGTATRVLLDVAQTPLTRYRAGTGASAAYDPATMPLEALVEREPVVADSGRQLELRAEAGLHFLRLLARSGVAKYEGAYRAAYPLARPAADVAATWDADSLRAVALYAGRVPDGLPLYQALVAVLGADGRGTAPLPATPAIAAADQASVRIAAAAWIRWCVAQGLSTTVEPRAWQPEHMEYGFAVAARTPEREVVLAAPEFHGGRLDWDTFVTRTDATLGAMPASRTTSCSVLPSPVSYRGMPSPRLWAFEDGRVNLGAASDAAPDLATKLLVEFALIYGNDWFVVPVEADVGGLVSVSALRVRDSFGIERPIPHHRVVDGPDGTWRMYAVTSLSGADDPIRQALFLAPTLGTRIESAPLEEVLFLRDEMANLAWAVERLVQGRAGPVVDRYERFQAERQRAAATEPAPAAASLADLAYRLGTAVPDYWVPLVPEESTDASGRLATRLRRGAMPRFGAAGVTGTVPPLGTLLQPGSPLALYEEEVPREGSRVTRAVQYTRWIGGSTHTWVGAHKLPGRGEGSSGLRFDSVEPNT